jgi:hypothetical protein
MFSGSTIGIVPTRPKRVPFAITVNNTSNSISILDITDPVNPVVLATISTGAGTGPYYVAIERNGLWAQIFCDTLHCIIPVDLKNLSAPVLKASVNLGGTGCTFGAIHPNNRVGYSTNQNQNTLTPIDLSNPFAPVVGTPLATNGTPPRGIAVRPQGDVLYVIHSGATGNIATFSLADPLNPVFQQLTAFAGNGGYRLAMSSDGADMYALLGGTNSVIPFSLAVPLVPVGFAGQSPITAIVPREGIVSSDGLCLSVGGSTTNPGVVGFNAINRTAPIAAGASYTASGGTNCWGVREMMGGRYAVQSNQGSNNLSIYDLSTYYKAVLKNTVATGGNGAYCVAVWDPRGAPCNNNKKVLINHSSLAAFAGLTNQQIAAAATHSVWLQRASIGGIIDTALTALQTSDARFSRTKFTLFNEGNPGWTVKLADFITHLGTTHHLADIFSAKFCYVDNRTPPSPTADPLQYISTLESLEAQYPTKTFFWWTIPIETVNNLALGAAYNSTIRAYCAAHGKNLFDIADIESHHVDGSPNTVGGIEALCSEYSSDGTHPDTSPAPEQLAKAFWLMIVAVTS